LLAKRFYSNCTVLTQLKVFWRANWALAREVQFAYRRDKVQCTAYGKLGSLSTDAPSLGFVEFFYLKSSRKFSGGMASKTTMVLPRRVLAHLFAYERRGLRSSFGVLKSS
jgi:hypothetical protein